MVLEGLSARPHPQGGRIDLTWRNPDPASFPGVRVVRRGDTHPAHPQDGVVVAEGLGLESVSDRGLRGEEIHYYALFPYHGDPPEYGDDARNRVSAPAMAPHGLAAHMYSLLPRIYHRYDTVLPDPAEADPADADKGQLRRFLDIPGGRLDMLLSQARLLLASHDVSKVDGRMLPLLAQWIGWKTDNKLGVAAQRQETINAPSLYRTVGIIPTVEATVKRMGAWESRTKEFVHNLFTSNAPMRLNLWQARAEAGGWTAEPAPLSLDFLHEGRAAAARDAGGRLWLFYHTERNGKWNIWCKHLEDAAAGAWSPSLPLTVRPGIDQHPAAASQGARLWVFWDSYAEGRGWRIDHRILEAGEWGPAAPWRADAVERRFPSAVADDEGGLWLFWLERTAGAWLLRYNVHKGGGWQAADLDFGGISAPDPQVETQPFALFHPVSRDIWLFWAGRRQGIPGIGQDRFRVRFRVKHNLLPDGSGWDAGVSALVDDADPDYHDREPAALAVPAGGIRLFWSSNRDGRWAVLETVFPGPAPVARATAGPFAARYALPLDAPGGPLLLFRSNAPVRHVSQVYGATEVVDFRHSGSTVPDTRDTVKSALRGDFEDFNTYTYDTGGSGGRNNEDWYGRDTIGLYLKTDSLDPSVNLARRQRVAGVLGEFMPATDRAVFIEEDAVAVEPVYAYTGIPGGEGGFIAETWSDHLESPFEEAPLAAEEDFSDELE